MAIDLRNVTMKKTSVKKVDKKNDDITLGRFIVLHEEFIRSKRLENLSDRTISDHKYFFSMFIKYVRSSNWFESDQRISHHVINAYILHMVEEKEYAPCTINVRIRPLKAYINWLKDNEYITSNINNHIKLQKVPKDKIQPLKQNNITKLIKVIGENTYIRFRDRTITLTILDCGIRVGELIQIQINDVDFKRGILIVRASVSKTRTERHLPLSDVTVQHLKELREISQENGVTDLFLSAGGSRVQLQDIQHNFRKYRDEAGITEKCTPYTLRHTFATEMVKQGVDVFTLQKIMGHQTLITTRQYVQLDDSHVFKAHKATNLLNNLLNGGK